MSAAPALALLLEDDEPDVRLAAAMALYDMGPGGHRLLKAIQPSADPRVVAIARRVRALPRRA